MNDAKQEVERVRGRLEELISFLWIAHDAGKARGDDADICAVLARIARDGETLTEDLEALSRRLRAPKPTETAQ